MPSTRDRILFALVVIVACSVWWSMIQPMRDVKALATLKESL